MGVEGILKTRLFRFTLLFLGLLVVFVLFIAVAFRLANHTNGRLVSAGENRSYLLYVPESYDPSAPVPLVITLHGFAQWPAHQMQLSRWNDLADEHGFIVVYPSGTRFPLRWRTWGAPASPRDPAQDVAFISDLIDRLEADYNIDPQRVYVNGMSNGGGMTFVLSCRLSDRIAAIGTVAAAFTTTWESCQPDRPVPTIVFHGTADRIVPFEGGPFPQADLEFPSVAEWVGELAERNGCSDTPRQIPARGDASGIEYTGCAADLVFYTIAGGGHSWPGGEPIPRWIVGETSTDIEATRTMWDFFQQHPLETR